MSPDHTDDDRTDDQTPQDQTRGADSDGDATDAKEQIVNQPADVEAAEDGLPVETDPPAAERGDARSSDDTGTAGTGSGSGSNDDSTDQATAPEDVTAELDTTSGGVGGAVQSDLARQGMFGANSSGDTSGYGRLTTTISFPGRTARPYGEGATGWFDSVADRLAELIPGYDPVVVVHRGEITLHVPRERLTEVAQQLRDDAQLRFEFCPSVSGVHYPEDQGRELHAVIHLVSMTHNRRIRVEVSVPDADPHLPSIVPIYPAADWHERETFDMFGIVFDGHPGLTRILMPDDWPGHPQRKDYPLGGIGVEYKGATIAPPDQRRSYH